MVDIRAVKESLKVVREFEKERDMKLLNEKGLSQFAEIWKKYENESTLKDYVDSAVKPLKQQLDAILAHFEQKGVKSVPVTVEKQQVQTEKDSWVKTSESDDLTIWKYGKHQINIYRDGRGNELANIDDTENIVVKGDTIAKLRAKVESMP